jgi:hypothetical protein
MVEAISILPERVTEESNTRREIVMLPSIKLCNLNICPGKAIALAEDFGYIFLDDGNRGDQRTHNRITFLGRCRPLKGFVAAIGMDATKPRGPDFARERRPVNFRVARCGTTKRETSIRG